MISKILKVLTLALAILFILSTISTAIDNDFPNCKYSPIGKKSFIFHCEIGDYIVVYCSTVDYANGKPLFTKALVSKVHLVKKDGTKVDVTSNFCPRY